MGSSALHEDRRGLDADLYAEEAVAEDASEAPESEQDDLWEKLLSAPRPVENAKASSLRQTISQVIFSKRPSISMPVWMKQLLQAVICKDMFSKTANL